MYVAEAFHIFAGNQQTTDKMENHKRILFVCLGNICRSPAAEGIFLKMAVEKGVAGSMTIDSAGTYGGHSGSLPDPRMREAAADRGYRLTHRARRFESDDFDRFDMIVVMDDSNYDKVCRLAPAPESLDKIRRMAEFCTRHDIDHVPDPYLEGREGFEYVLDILEDGCASLLEEISGN